MECSATLQIAGPTGDFDRIFKVANAALYLRIPR